MALEDFLKQKNTNALLPGTTTTKSQPGSLASFLAGENQAFSVNMPTNTPGSQGGALRGLRWIGKQLMKPVSVVAATAENLGKVSAGLISSIKNKNFEEANQAVAQFGQELPGQVKDVLTGKLERSFADIWRDNLIPVLQKEDPKTFSDFFIPSLVADLVGTTFDIAADPLNFAGGILTKGTQVTGKVISKIPGATKAGGILKKAFSTSSGNKAVDSLIDEFKSLGDYKRANILEEARKIEKAVIKLPKDDIIKVSNYLEKGTKSTPEVEAIGKRLQGFYKEWKSIEKTLGVKGGEISGYAPHVRIQEPILQRVKNFITPFRQFTGKLGGPAQGRKILKFVSRDGEVLIGKAENLGLKETTIGFKDATGKFFSPGQASIDEIAKAFEKQFFEQNPAIQMAYRGMAYAKATTGKQFFSAVKKFAIKDGMAVTTPELKGLKFEEGVARAVDMYSQGLKPEELKTVLRAFDAVQNLWKGQVLIAPSYHVRNFASNIWNNFLAGVKNPVSYFKSARLQMGKNIKVGGVLKGKTTQEITTIMKQRGVFNQGWYAADIPTSVEQGVKATWKQGINPLSGQNYAIKLNRAVGSAVENNARGAHFIEQIEKGMSIDDAVMSVKKFLFDYGDLTTFEKTVMKRVFPFYTWTRKNIPLQLEALVTQPGKFAGIEKVVRGIENLSMGSALPANEKYLADYIKNNTPMRVKYNEETKTYYYFLLGNWLPSYQMIDFLSQPLQNVTAMVTPLLKTPIEILYNKSSFFRNTLGENEAIENYPGDSTNFMGMTMPKRVALVLQNIRVLNELNKLNPGKIFGGQYAEPSLWKKLNFPTVNIPGVGIISPATSKYGRTMPAPTRSERFAGLLFGKLQAYKPSFSQSQYQWDTDERTTQYIQAINSALKQGDKERAKLIRRELQNFLKNRK